MVMINELDPSGPTDAELLDDIEEAVRDLENGATWILLDEFDRDFRARHNPRRSTIPFGDEAQ